MTEPHINLKPLDPNQTYETSEQAITDLFMRKLNGKNWNFGGKKFGQTIQEQKKINKAVKDRDYSAFKAERRKGYWKITLSK